MKQSSIISVHNLTKTFGEFTAVNNISFEVDFPETTIEALKAMGYTTAKRGYFGRMDGVVILDNGKKQAAGDKRGDDSVAGF